MKQFFIFSLLAIIVIACEVDKKDTPPKDGPNDQSEELIKNEFAAIPMPSVLVTGNSFPTDSNEINSWIANSHPVNNTETNEDIINHGWGIWSALTEVTDQSYNRQRLRRFETWYTPQDIIYAFNQKKKNPSFELNHVQRNTGTLAKLNQLHGLPHDPGNLQSDVLGFVKYDPTSADHIYDNDLFYLSTLQKYMIPGGIGRIPNFPNSGVALKPVFITLDSLKPNTDLYVIPVWPGNDGNPNRPFGSGAWNNFVYVSLNSPTNAAEKIYNIKEFIHFTANSSGTIQYNILAAMHVNSRETKRWTWQTFWWSEYKNGIPHSPSSKQIADLRLDKNLDRGASHYAMAVAYNMVAPAQPYNGGSGADATSIYAYNPYLEAGFGLPTFTTGNADVRKFYPEEYQKVGGFLNKYGMQSNCMSCHGQARHTPNLYQGAGHFYLTDQYTELNAPYFIDKVSLDFTWSIQDHIINDQGKIIK